MEEESTNNQHIMAQKRYRQTDKGKATEEKYENNAHLILFQLHGPSLSRSLKKFLIE